MDRRLHEDTGRVSFLLVNFFFEEDFLLNEN